jgi:hypothetical protein
MRLRSIGTVGSAALAVGGLLFLFGSTSSADTSGPVSANLSVTSTTGTPPPPVRSITVSPSTVSYGNCDFNPGQNNLTFPNGECSTTVAPGPGLQPGITITNGAAAGHVDVQTSDFVPSDNGTPWTPCVSDSSVSTAPKCTGPAGSGSFKYPGVNEFAAATNDVALSTGGPYLGTTAECDTQFDAGDCVAAANASTIEALEITGPSSASDSSLNYTETVTWTAVP